MRVRQAHGKNVYFVRNAASTTRHRSRCAWTIGVVRAASRDASRIDRASCVAINVGGDCSAEELKARLRVKFDGA
jgi:hypothetical protein